MVDLTTERRVATKLMESLVSCTEDERDEVLYYLLARYGSVGQECGNVWSASVCCWSEAGDVRHGIGMRRLRLHLGARYESVELQRNSHHVHSHTSPQSPYAGTRAAPLCSSTLCL